MKHIIFPVICGLHLKRTMSTWWPRVSLAIFDTTFCCESYSSGQDLYCKEGEAATLTNEAVLTGIATRGRALPGWKLIGLCLVGDTVKSLASVSRVVIGSGPY